VKIQPPSFQFRKRPALEVLLRAPGVEHGDGFGGELDDP